MSKGLFYIGQPVICINDNFSWARKRYAQVHSYPVAGSRYRVRGYVCEGAKPAIVLWELTNPTVMYMDGVIREAGFWEGRFVAAPLPEAISQYSTVTKKKVMSMEDF